MVAKPGSWAAPYAAGTTFKFNGWQIRLDPAQVGITAPDIVGDEPAPAGHTFVLVPMTSTRAALGSEEPVLGLNLAFVGGNGVVYTSFPVVDGQEYWCPGADDDWINGPELYQGGTASVSACRLVASDAISGGRWRLRGDAGEVFVRP